MIKKLKLGLLVAMLSLSVGVGLAHADDLNWTDNKTISVNGVNVVVQAGSTATTLVVDTNTFTVTVPSGSTFAVVSPDRYLLTNNLGLGQVCTGSQNSVNVVGASGGTTVQFSPVATTCTFSGGGGLVTTVPAGGGGGGGSSSTPPPPTTLTITSTTPTPTTIAGCNGSTGFSTTTGQSCSGNTVVVTTTTPVSIPGCNNGTSGFSITSGGSCAGNTSTVTTTTSYNFGTVTLRNGSTGSGVMALQNFLNRFLNLGLVVDGRLGPKTIAVIKKWQASKGLVADGLIGPQTKAMMNTQAENGY